MENTFFATIARMKYIERWALMHSSRRETLSEHSMDVAVIAHALCVIGNVRYHRHLNAERAALIGLYHDASEIITGDMPTPVKYSSGRIRDAYHAVEEKAQERLLEGLPEDLRGVYARIFFPQLEDLTGETDAEDAYMRRLVKAADKLSALIKCMEELSTGNGEFRTARETISASVKQLCDELPEAADFAKDFLPFYGATLDELLADGPSTREN